LPAEPNNVLINFYQKYFTPHFLMHSDSFHKNQKAAENKLNSKIPKIIFWHNFSCLIISMIYPFSSAIYQQTENHCHD